MQPAANSDTIAEQQSLNVALHARYLLALKGHRRGAFVLGFFCGFMTFSSFALIAWKAFPHLSH